MKWIKEHKLITCLVVIIIAATVFLASAINTGGTGNSGTSLINSVVTAVETPIVKLAKSISNGVSGMFSYKSIQAENEALKEENAKLQSELMENKVAKNELRELKDLANSLNYSMVNSNKLVTGDIVSYDGASFINMFSINVGTADKVKTNDIVLYGKCLVGRIVETGKHTAKVVSLIDESCKVSFKVSRDENIVGIIQGGTKGSLNGYMLDGDATIVEGDKLITSGMGLFPKGVEIGTVLEVKYDSDSKLKTIKVKPSMDMSSMQKVTVVI